MVHTWAYDSIVKSHWLWFVGQFLQPFWRPRVSFLLRNWVDVKLPYPALAYPTSASMISFQGSILQLRFFWCVICYLLIYQRQLPSAKQVPKNKHIVMLVKAYLHGIPSRVTFVLASRTVDLIRIDMACVSCHISRGGD